MVQSGSELSTMLFKFTWGRADALEVGKLPHLSSQMHLHAGNTLPFNMPISKTL